MTPEEIAKGIDDKFDALKSKVDGAAQKTDLDAIKTELEELKTKGASAEQVKSVEDKLDEIATKMVELETKGGQSAEKGSFVTFVEENIKKNNLTKDNPKPANSYGATETVKAAALMTTANVIPNVAGGYSPLFGNYIDNEIGHTPKPESIFMSLVTVKFQPGTENIYFTDRINEEGTAQFIAEGALKPLADAEWKTTSLPVRELAVRWKFTTRLMFHAPAIVSDFREHVNQLVDQELDDAVLEGDNTGNNMNGIIANASAFVVPTALANAYAEANIYDAIMALATQIRLSNFKGKITAVLNTAWAALMWSIKDTEGRYIIPPFRSADGKMIGEVEIKFTNKIASTHILVGDLKKFNLVISEDAIYSEGFENDDFSKNLVSRKIETFAQGYIKQSDEGAIIYDAIADILTDIEVVPTP